MATRAIMGRFIRRLLQLSVVAFVVYTALGGPFRNFKLAHNHRRLVGLMEGDLWAFLYGANEDLLALAGDAYRASFAWLGFPWAARVAGFDTVDPLLAASLGLQSGSLPASTLASLVIPVSIAALLGKVFCSHLCPMRLLFEVGALVRRGLTRLGVELPAVPPNAGGRLGGFVLLGGLLASLSAGTAIWLFVLPYVSLSAGIFLAITAGTTAGLGLVVLFWFLVDVLFAPGYFCHSLCPTGFLLEQLGRLAPFRLKKQGAEPCPANCSACQKACPYNLYPREETHRPACDNCGQCASVCPSHRLSRRFSLPLISAATVAIWVVSSGPALAHHNKGLPHYGYFKNYPQVPTEEYIRIAGRWEIGATIFNFQGLDRRTADTPNDVKIYLYLYDLVADAAYVGPLAVELHHEGRVVARFERLEVDEEAVYSTRETLPESGEYALVALVGGPQPTDRVVLPFFVDLHGDGIGFATLALTATPFMLVFGLALLGRRRRRTLARRSRGAAATVLLPLALLGLAVPTDAKAEQERAHAPAGERCKHCGMLNCPMDHSAGDASSAPSHAAMVHYATEDGGEVMVMGGMPLWLLLFGAAAIIALSFVAVEMTGKRPTAPARSLYPTRNLIKRRRTYRVLRSRWLQAIPQLASAGVLGFLVYAGLFGSSARNITPVAVWTLWWSALIFGVLVLGSAWCFACPWDGLANLASRLRVAARVETLSFKLPYPRWLANSYPAIALFSLLTWLELGYGVTTNPQTTAYLGLGMALLAATAALLWDGKRFCAHMCPVGRICGIYSNFSPLEIRARNPRTCQVCTTEDCLHGNDKGYPCPTGISLKTVQDATQCTACTECIKSCHKHNVALNLRPFGADLLTGHTPKRDEAWLALALLSLTLFHGLSMTPAWESFAPGQMSILKWLAVTLDTPKILNFTLAMAVVVALPVLVYALCCRLAARWAGDGVSGSTLFTAYAYSLLPVALCYHLAHNLMHLLMEGGQVVPLLSDPLGDGSDYFATAGVHVGALLGDQPLWLMQVAFVVVGHIYGIVVAHRIGHRVHATRKAARRSLIPIPVAMVMISVCGLWLMHMDMNMRVGRM
ncbi:MAG: 4Fe-4S binding protein [Myxococcales bacterium]|nr:4Fe-4S binding protein [Myxococcales bacterium]